MEAAFSVQGVLTSELCRILSEVLGKNNKKPITATPEFQRLSAERMNPWHVKVFGGQGIASYLKHLGTTNVTGKPTPPGSSEFPGVPDWQPAGVPTIDEVAVVIWCGNELSKGSTHLRSTPQLWKEAASLANLLTHFKYSIIIGPGTAECWQIGEIAGGDSR